MSNGLGPPSETEPEREAGDEQRREDEQAGEVATSEKGCVGAAAGRQWT